MKWLLFFILPIFLLANPTLDEVLKYPKSYYRDFWLTEYLKQSKGKEAEKIYKAITHKKNYHLKLLANRYPPYKKIYECKHVNRYNWKKEPIECILKHGFSVWNIKRMKLKDIQELFNILPDSKVKTRLEIVKNKDYKKAFKDNDLFYSIFLSYIPDVYIPEIYINNIAKDRRFKYLLALVVRSHRYKMKKSFLKINYKALSDRNKFVLALNAIDLHRYNLAVKILESKQNKTNQDNFWLYLLTKKQKYANELLNKNRMDLYTLYIYEKFHKPYKLDKLKVYNTAKVKYDINNPLDVIQFYKDKAKTKDYFKFAKTLDNKKMLPLKALILDKAYHYTKNYYIMPKYNLND